MAVPKNAPNSVQAAGEAAAKFLQAFKGVVPGDGPDAAKDLAELQAAEAYAAHVDRVGANRPGVIAWANLWAPQVTRHGVERQDPGNDLPADPG